ncbi:M20 family metallopeptidase [Chloroflexota bacterium]
MNTNEIKQLKLMIQQDIDSHREELVNLSLKIHKNPEVCWQEKKASRWLSNYLESYGFRVQKEPHNLPTAFEASYGIGKPIVAVLCEYDSPTEQEHSCGHNIIATSAVGASIASKSIVDKFGGTILVLGCPAEECLGGKVIMVEDGAFKNIDVTMMLHPIGQHNWVGSRSTACIYLKVEFWGKRAHTAHNPWDGISALEALLQSFHNIDALRFQTREKSRISGIITDGGKAANIVPEHSSGTFMIRAADDTYLEELRDKVLNCFKAASLSTGARLEHQWGMKCNAMNPNNSLVQLWSHNMEQLGLSVAGILESTNSTDMGNVSVVVPSMHPYIAISSEPIIPHTSQFTEAAISDAGKKATIDGAKALAMTVTDVLIEPNNLTRIRNEFLNKDE